MPRRNYRQRKGVVSLFQTAGTRYGMTVLADGGLKKTPDPLVQC